MNNKKEKYYLKMVKKNMNHIT